MQNINVRLDDRTEKQLHELERHFASIDVLDRAPSTSDIVRRAIALMHSRFLSTDEDRQDATDMVVPLMESLKATLDALAEDREQVRS